MADLLGSLLVRLAADAGQFESDLGRAARIAERNAKNIEKKFADMAVKVGGAMAAAAAAAATATAALAKQAINTADDFAKMSQKVGVSVEALSTLEYAAAQSGLSVQQLQGGLTKLAKNASDAAAGTGEAIKGFDAMGVSVTDSSGKLKTTEQLLLEVSKKMAGYEDSAQKTALAVQIFGRAGADMMPFLNAGAEGIQELQERARELGLEIGGSAAKQAEAFNDLLSDIGRIAQGLGNDLARELLPQLEETAKWFVESAIAARQAWLEEGGIKHTIEQIVSAAKTLLSVLDELAVFMATRFVIMGIAPAVAALGGMTVSLTAVSAAIGRAILATQAWSIAIAANPVGLIATAAALAATGIYSLATAEEALAESVVDANKALEEAAKLVDTNRVAAINRLGVTREEIIADIEAAKAKLELAKAELAVKTARNTSNFGLGGSASDLAEIATLTREISALDGKIAEVDQRFVEIAKGGISEFLRGLFGLEDRAKNGTAPAITDLASRTKELNKALGDWAKLQKQHDAELMKSEQAALDAARARDDLASKFAQQAADLQNEIALLGMSGAAREAYAIQLQAENMARDANGKVVKEQAKQFEALLAELNESAKLDEILSGLNDIGFGGLISDLEAVGDAIEEALAGRGKRSVDELRAAMGVLRQEMLVGVVGVAQQTLGAMQSLAEEGSSAYKAIAVAQQALNVVMAIGAIVNQGMGDPYTAFARMAAMAAAVAGLVGSLSTNFGGFGDTAAQRQATQGTGTVLGDPEAKSESILRATEITAEATSKLVGINTGMLRALVNLQNAIGAATGMLARGAGDVDFGAVGAPPINNWHRFNNQLANVLTFGLFDRFLSGLAQRLTGARNRVTDTGIMIGGGIITDLMNGITVGAYQETQSRSWWFGRTHTNVSTQPLGEDVANQFQLIMNSIVDTVREGALALGLTAEQIEQALATFRLEEIRISLMDLTAEEQQAELEAVFSSIFDGLAGAVIPWIGQFQQVGEGLGETLVRVATNVQVMQEAISRLGLSLETTGPEQFAQISVALVEMVGGIEEFIDRMSSFVDAFAPEAHKFALLQNDLSDAFAQAGLTIPPTRDAMWELMQSLDASTESGREQIATLLRLTDVADAYYSALEDAWNDYYDTFYTESERAVRAAEQAHSAASDAFSAIGLSVSDFTGSNGLAQFRNLFESVLPTLTQDQVGLWLQAAAALGLMNEAIMEVIATARAAYEEARRLADLRGVGGGRGVGNSGSGGGGRQNPGPIFGGDPGGGYTPPTTPYPSIPPGTIPDIVDIAPDFSAQLADLLDRLRFEDSLRGLSEYERELAQINRQWDETIAQAALWEASAAELAELEMYRQAELMEAMQRRYDAEMEYVESLRGYIDSLLLDDAVTTLTPQEQLTEARRQYEQLLSSALGGDVAARDQLQGAADTYLRLARGFFGSTDQYSTIFDSVTTGLGELAAAIATAAELQMISTGGEANWTFEPQAMQATFEAAAEPTVDEIRGLREDGETQTEAMITRFEQLIAEVKELKSPADRTARGVEQLVVEGKRRA